MIQNNRQNAHQEIDLIFKELLPARGMAERPAQIALSHKMLDAMLDDSIALCDAGTGMNQLAAVAAVGIIFPTLPAQMDTAVPQIPVAPDSLPAFIAHNRTFIPAVDTEIMAIEGALFRDGVLLVAIVTDEGASHLDSPPTKYSTEKKRLVYCSSCSSVRLSKWSESEGAEHRKKGPAMMS